MQEHNNIDSDEVSKFDRMAARWWDPKGEFRPLHELNPVRLRFISGHVVLAGAKVLDVGCGGGILSEAMAKAGASVTGIDMAEKALNVARLHAADSGLEIGYHAGTAEAHLEKHAGEYDIVTCLELLEHVPDPASLVTSCAQLARPGGRVFFSTINRTMKAYALAVVGAEYIMRLLPKGTHDYEKFIKPSELSAWSRDAGLNLIEQAGMHYNPVFGSASLNNNVDVNYLACYARPEES